jgi:hypothetical protein
MNALSPASRPQQVAEKGLAADGRRWTQIENKESIGVDLRLSAAWNGLFNILLGPRMMFIDDCPQPGT